MLGNIHELTTSAASLTAESRDLSLRAEMAAAAADAISRAKIMSSELKGLFT